MALKIFLSSVDEEFRAERNAIREQIERLGEHCVCMERYGAVPQAAAEYDAVLVATCDLYVCLAGQGYGSIEPHSGKSYTEAEFDAAVMRHLPCLIYFKDSAANDDPRQAAFKSRLRGPERIVYSFRTVEELKTQFLLDFIRELRTTLLDKFAIEPLGPLSWQTIHSLTAGILKEQIRIVAGDRYLPDLYVSRQLEKAIDDFTHFDKVFVERSLTLLDDLHTASRHYGLTTRTSEPLAKARIALEQQDLDGLLHTLDSVKRSFFYTEIAADILAINHALSAPEDELTKADAEVIGRLRLRSFISNESLSEVPTLLQEARRESHVKGGNTTRFLIDLFPSSPVGTGRRRVLTNELLDEITLLTAKASKSCLAIVSRAGTGKTNLICSVAEKLIVESPTMLLSGNLEISQQSDLESHIEKYLENSFGRNLSNWLQRTDGSLSESKQWLYILIDGINENTNGATLVRRLKTLLARTKGRRVKLIVTCRDVGWEQFSGAFEDSLFCAPLALTQFTDHEWSIVFPRYFAKFDITASLSPEARSALQNPILLRFFCIVHRGETVGEVTRVNLNTVFGKFIERLQQIAHENLGLNGNACLELLFGVVRHMWAQGALNCALAARSLIVTDPASLNAAWVVLKSEGVFLEEPPTPPLKMAKSFRFTYDELMEYVLARSWIEYEDVNNPKALDILIERALMVMPQFSCAVGAILYLDKELGKNGYLVDRAFVLGRDTIVELMASRQVQLLYLCEALSADSAISTTIDQIDRFEQIASPLVRERLAKVIIGILHNQPGNPKIRNIAARMLEANHESVTSTSENAERRFVGPTAEDPQAHELSESAPDKASEIRETARLPDFGEKSESTKPRLPPPSYHYSEATRLEAIAVLIGFGDEEARDVALQGIKAVGSVQLHSALEALRAMDGAADSIVYGSVRHFMGSLIPEYRIFCAWLLRNRYGPEPAALLAALSTDDSQRVYEYTISLFAVRLIEPELIKAACNHLVRAPKLAVWHQINLIRLITKRPQFQKAELVDFARIIDAVRPLCGAGHPQVRLEAYRCILSFPECVAPDQILAEVRKDSDRYVRSIAVSYSQRPSD